ncbi:uroporphyrinogen-III synthase [Brachybacterium sp. GCM10030267]|uniref:uroporphyrinogen-III synthase n=1 Tax=unclassified Brachybacterium TaxID=2623841 RepID=UPI003610CC78
MTHPSRGRPVLVTRPAGRADGLVALLEELGLTVRHQPLVRLVLEGGPELTAALDRLAAGAFTQLVVTSRTAVEAMLVRSPSVTVHPNTQVVAVGEGTASALTTAGAPPDLVASGSGAALVREIPPADVSPGAAGAAGTAGPATVLFPASAAASPVVPDGLRAKGYRVEHVIAYRPEPVEPPAEFARALAAGDVGAIVLTSPMAARLAAELGVHASIPVVTIGDPTSEAARAAGLDVTQQAAAPTDADLADAVRAVLARP